MTRTATFLILFSLLSVAMVYAQADHQKISFLEGGLIEEPPLEAGDGFGFAVAALGDLNGDGIPDVAAGAPGDDDGGPNRGTVWVLFLNTDGSVKRKQKISATEGGFSGALNDQDRFGSALANLGDFDGDGTNDLVVGAPDDDGGGLDRGALWLLMLNPDGTVKAQQKISATEGELPLVLSDEDHFGAAVTALGDLDGDGVTDLAVGADRKTGGTPRDRGIAWILFMKGDGSVKEARSLEVLEVALEVGDRFGSALAGLGDLDGDGRPDLAVGAKGDDDGGPQRGAVYVLFLNRDGSVKGHQKISATEGGFDDESTQDSGEFGGSIARLGDLDGDGVPELAVGEPNFSGDIMAGRFVVGRVFTLFLYSSGRVKDQNWVELSGSETTPHYGSAVTGLGDLDGDGTPDLVVGHPDDGEGSVYVHKLQAVGRVILEKISATEGNFAVFIDDESTLGPSMTALDDLNGDGIEDLAVCNGLDTPYMWILLLNPDGSVKHPQQVDLDQAERGCFGSMVPLPDVNGDGTPDLAVSDPWFAEPETERIGRIWILLLNRDGTVKGFQRIAHTEGGPLSFLTEGSEFGSGLSHLGDLDGNGVPDLAVGFYEGGQGELDVVMLLLNPDGTVESATITARDLGTESGFLPVGDLDDNGIVDLVLTTPTRNEFTLLLLDEAGSVRDRIPISATEGGFTGRLADGDGFGASVANLGDLNGDGIPDLAVGVSGDDDGGVGRGAVYLLFLKPDFTVKTHRKISSTRGNFTGGLDDRDRFGGHVVRLGDLDGDGLAELGVSADGDDDGTLDAGALWILFSTAYLPSLIEEVTVSPEQAPSGANIQISAQITDVRGIEQTSVSFRRAGDPTFFSSPMTPQGNDRYHFTIPAFVVGERGIEYFITTTNGLGNTTRAPETDFLSLPVYLPDGVLLPLHSGTAADAYRLVSIPLQLEETDARTVLEASLGPYNVKRWRFYGFHNGDDLIELSEQDFVLAPGDAYWLLIKNAGNLLTTGPGTTLPTDMPVQVPLQGGWNTLGNSFTFPVPLSGLLMQSGQTVDLRRYDGAWNSVDSLLQPLEGYAIFSNELLDTLWVSPRAAPLPEVEARHTVSKGTTDEAWSIAIHAHAGLARDTDNHASVSAHAAPGFDPLDRPEPPVIGDYVSVDFPHEDWQRTATRYSTDARPLSEGETIWTFEVRTHQPERVELSFEGLADVPATYGVWLVDDLVSVQQDLRENPSYVVGTGGETVAGRRLKLVVAPATEREGSAEVPQQFALSQNFPNPFNPSTTLRYGVPEASQVRVAVYDVLGRRVALLVEGAVPAGHHVVVWDGRSDAGAAVGSGVYLLRMQAGAFTQTRMMMIVK